MCIEMCPRHLTLVEPVGLPQGHGSWLNPGKYCFDHPLQTLQAAVSPKQLSDC